MTINTVIMVDHIQIREDLRAALASIDEVWPQMEEWCAEWDKLCERRWRINGYLSELGGKPSSIESCDIRWRGWLRDMLFIAESATQPFNITGDDAIYLRDWKHGANIKKFHEQLARGRAEMQKRLVELEEMEASHLAELQRSAEVIQESFDQSQRPVKKGFWAKLSEMLDG